MSICGAGGGVNVPGLKVRRNTETIPLHAVGQLPSKHQVYTEMCTRAHVGIHTDPQTENESQGVLASRLDSRI